MDHVDDTRYQHENIFRRKRGTVGNLSILPRLRLFESRNE